MKPLVVTLLAALCLSAQTAPTIESLTAQINSDHKKLADWAGLNVFGSDDSEIPAPRPGENRVVFLGDTVTANWGKGKAPFFPGKPWFNRGIASQTTPQMLVRFRQDVVELNPKAVVIEGGLYDIGMVMGPGSEGTITDNLETMIDVAKVHGIKVVIASMTPVCNCYDVQTRLRPPGKIAAINATLRGLAKSSGSVYLNYYSVLVDPATRQLKKALTSDGVTPNDAGYALMAPLAEQAVADALAAR